MISITQYKNTIIERSNALSLKKVILQYQLRQKRFVLVKYYFLLFEIL